jgi:hypothetical protein
MFCPKCATQNLEGASYCRVCGANISLVPQALSGQLVQAKEENASETGRHGRRRKRGELSLDQALKNVFMGIAFLLIAIALSFSMGGRGWWFWMLIPAFSLMGTGVAQYIRLKEEQKRAFGPSGPMQPSLPPASRVNSLPTRHTGDVVPPPSVTESTTRHLGAEAPTRHLDPSTETPE